MQSPNDQRTETQKIARNTFKQIIVPLMSNSILESSIIDILLLERIGLTPYFLTPIVDSYAHAVSAQRTRRRTHVRTRARRCAADCLGSVSGTRDCGSRDEFPSVHYRSTLQALICKHHSFIIFIQLDLIAFHASCVLTDTFDTFDLRCSALGPCAFPSSSTRSRSSTSSCGGTPSTRSRSRAKSKSSCTSASDASRRARSTRVCVL